MAEWKWHSRKTHYALSESPHKLCSQPVATHTTLSASCHTHYAFSQSPHTLRSQPVATHTHTHTHTTLSASRHTHYDLSKSPHTLRSPPTANQTASNGDDIDQGGVEETCTAATVQAVVGGLEWDLIKLQFVEGNKLSEHRVGQGRGDEPLFSVQALFGTGLVTLEKVTALS